MHGHLARDCPLTKGVMSQGSAVLALPMENSLNPGIKAHSVDEAVDGKSGSVPSMSCTMRTGTNTPWTMQVSCTSHWTLDRL